MFPNLMQTVQYILKCRRVVVFIMPVTYKLTIKSYFTRLSSLHIVIHDKTLEEQKLGNGKPSFEY